MSVLKLTLECLHHLLPAAILDFNKKLKCCNSEFKTSLKRKQTLLKYQKLYTVYFTSEIATFLSLPFPTYNKPVL